MIPQELTLSTPDLGLKQYQSRRPGWPLALRDLLARRRTTTFVRARFSLAAALVDATVIVATAVGVGVVYHRIVYGVGGLVGTFAQIGSLIALLFVTSNILRDEYGISVYLTFAGHARRVLLTWNMAFLTMLVFIFATKRTGEYSGRAWASSTGSASSSWSGAAPSSSSN